MKQLTALSLTASLLCAVILTGCSGGVEEKTIQVKEHTSLDEARQYLENYAKGQALGSESDGFDQLVTKIREKNPQEADVVEKAFADIKAKPASRQSIAKQALAKLPQSAPPPSN